MNLGSGHMSKILGLIILVLDILAIIKIVQSGASTGEKILWVILVLVLPVLGLVIWALLGPGSPVKK
ncbi:MAG TPA: PLDc N-terminal domain-containing protein [Alcanivorax sp.]|nr:PLDc N-terminal domain-containing protein [Alcanivorax sp.]